MTKQHVKGFIAAVATALSLFGGHRAYQLYKALTVVEQLAQIVAQDQKSGQQFTVADVLTELAAQRIQEKIQSQKQEETPKASK